MNRITEIQDLIEQKKSALDSFIEEQTKTPNRRASMANQGIVRRHSIMSKGIAMNQFLQKEDSDFKKGVDTTKEILKDVKLMNMKLDDISGLVKVQRQKLLNMQDKIKESQDYMKRSKKLLTTFSKEIYGDKIIMTLGTLIAIVLVCIAIAALRYKMKAEQIMLVAEDPIESTMDFNEINESLFYKENITEVAQEAFNDTKKYIGQQMASFFETMQKKNQENRAKRAEAGEVLPEEKKIRIEDIRNNTEKSKNNIWTNNKKFEDFGNQAIARNFLSTSDSLKRLITQGEKLKKKKKKKDGVLLLL